MTRLRSMEARVFLGATSIALVHALDDAFAHRGPGLGAGQHAAAGVLALGAAVTAVAVFPSLRPGLRAALAFSFGCLALANGVLHAGHVAADHVSAADVTGVLAAAAGAVLIALAVHIPWSHRGRGSWTSRAVAVPAALLGALLVLGPVVLGVVATHKWREPVGRPPTSDYRDVSFRASDGLRLAGWYRPSHNGASVVVVHGGSSDRRGAMAHAELLARHGYGALVYDARGRGESEGSENNYGWDWDKDLDGALAFLRRRPDVEPGRIGAIGLSTGADALLAVAARRPDLAAVVTDGAAAASFADWHHLRGTDLGAVPGWVMFSTIRVLSGDAPPPPLVDQVRRLPMPTLLISAGADEEREFNVLYGSTGNGRVEHWNLPGAHHTRAIREHPDRYERRVVSFLDRALS
jgi:uncharacterized membrane protein HdeD (DUF308 family)